MKKLPPQLPCGVSFSARVGRKKFKYFPSFLSYLERKEVVEIIPYRDHLYIAECSNGTEFIFLFKLEEKNFGTDTNEFLLGEVLPYLKNLS